MLPHAKPCGRPGPVLVAIRPENLRLSADAGVANSFSGTVQAVMPLGATIAYDVAVAGGTPLKVLQMRGAGLTGRFICISPTLPFAPSFSTDVFFQEQRMTDRHPLSRRTFIGSGVAAAALSSSFVAGFSTTAHAAGSLNATTYPGTWETAQRKLLLPAFTQATGASVALQPVPALEAVAKVAASKANPPFDVVLMDEGPYLSALNLGIFAPLPRDKLKNLAELPDNFIDPNGFGAFVSAQVMGIVYNPTTIKTPPTSWSDLWKPEYKGRVGITGLGSSLGSAWMVAIAKLNGGSESNMEPAFEAVKRLLPSVGAVAPNPGALATLFQQGQIDISYNFVNGILPLMQRGVDVAIAKPESGWMIVRNSLHVIQNSQNLDLRYAYVDTALSAAVQKQMAAAPNFLAPTNRNVAFGVEMQKEAMNNAELAKLPLVDWKTLILLIVLPLLTSAVVRTFA